MDYEDFYEAKRKALKLINRLNYDIIQSVICDIYCLLFYKSFQFHVSPAINNTHALIQQRVSKSGTFTCTYTYIGLRSERRYTEHLQKKWMQLQTTMLQKNGSDALNTRYWITIQYVYKRSASQRNSFNSKDSWEHLLRKGVAPIREIPARTKMVEQTNMFLVSNWFLLPFLWECVKIASLLFNR